MLFFACEGQSEVAIRITAAYEARGGTGKAPFAWVENCPRLLGPNADKILAAMVKQAAEHMMREFGWRPRVGQVRVLQVPPGNRRHQDQGRRP